MKHLYDVFAANSLFLGGFGLIITGLISYWMKEIPLRVWNLFVRNFTTSLSITNSHKIFYDVLMYIRHNYAHRAFRSLKVNNGRYGNDDKNTISVGFGVHYIKYHNRYIRIDYRRMENNEQEDKELITITKLGRGNGLFVEFIKDTDIISADTIKLYRFNGHDWDFVRESIKRHFSSIYIEESKKKLLIDSIDDFKNKEQWYIKNGIPYQLGFLLQGPPGTGKTSIVKAIASHFNSPIYYLSVNQISTIQQAFADIPDNVLVVIEDIDGADVTHARGNKKLDSNEPPQALPKKHYLKQNNDYTSSTFSSISEVLNAIDGIFAPSGRILIMTTNRPEILDEALTRPGRVDYCVEIGYVNTEVLKAFMNNFFPGNTIDYETIKIKEELTTAILQNYVQSKLSADQIIELIST